MQDEVDQLKQQLADRDAIIAQLRQELADTKEQAETDKKKLSDYIADLEKKLQEAMHE